MLGHESDMMMAVSIGIALMVEAVQTSEMLVNLYHSTWCYNPERQPSS
jgi:hypothetical protein